MRKQSILNTTTTEIWRTVQDFPNYQISNLGNCRSLKSNKILKPYSNGGGYLKVGLCNHGQRKQEYLHRLVAEAFIPNPHNLPTVNHRTGIRNQNDSRNLEWASHADQQADIAFRRWFGYEDDKPVEPKITQIDLWMRVYFSH